MVVANTDWFWETDRRYIVSSVNGALREWLQIGKIEITGRAMRQIMPDELWTRCRDAFVGMGSPDEAISFDYEHFENQVLTARRRVCCRIAPDHPDRVVWYAYNIDQYYDMLQDLQSVMYEIESEREAMHEHALIARLSQSGHFVYVSDPFARQCGLTARDMIGKSYNLIGADFDGEPDRAKLVQKLLTGQPWKGEVTIKQPDGTPQFWQTSIVPLWDRDGKLLELFHISHDNTSARASQRLLEAQKQLLEHAVATRTRELAMANAKLEADFVARAALLEETARLASIVENTTDIVGISTYNGNVTYMNRAARRFFGIPQDEDISRTLTPDYLPSHASSHLIKTAMPQAKEHGTWAGESTLYKADGVEVPVSLVVLADKNDAGQVRHFTSIARDIREIKSKESKLKAQNEVLAKLNHELESVQHQLIQSEKMASIGQLAAGVAHEINNPIGYVNSNISSLDSYIGELLELLTAYEAAFEGPNAPVCPDRLSATRQRIDMRYLRDDVQSLVNESKEGIGRVRKIVQDLKDFSRVDTVEEWEYADLHRCIDTTLNIVRNEVKYKAEIIQTYAELPPVLCLPSQLNQVFLNMLVNAAHAIGDRGVISIRTGIQGERVWVEFEDNGEGMSPEVQKRIFEPFYTTKPVGKGTGLGLSLSYSIIQKHHGAIELNSTEGVGTRFRIYVPISQPLPVANDALEGDQNGK